MLVRSAIIFVGCPLASWTAYLSFACLSPKQILGMGSQRACPPCGCRCTRWCIVITLDGSSVRRDTLSGMTSLLEPVIKVQSLDALEMPLVVGHQTMPFDDGGRGYQDVGVADEFASLVEIGIDLRCPNNDGI